METRRGGRACAARRAGPGGVRRFRQPPAGGTSQAANQGTSGPGAGPADSYLATGQGWVDYIQWDATGTGTLTEDTLLGAAPQEAVISRQFPITVTINGSSVDISGLNEAKYGTLSGGTLTLQVLNQNSGQLGSDTFTAAGQDAFNAAVQTLQHQVQSDNNTALHQQAQASQASANTAAEQKASSGLATVQGISFSSDLGQMASDVKKTNSDLADEKTAAAAGQDGPGGPQCYNLTANVDYDAESNVEYDAQNNFGYDLQYNLQPHISSDRSATSALQNDLSTLQGMGLAAPSGAQSAISAAQSVISQAVSAANADIQQVNSDVSQAYSLANGMATGNCAGDGPGSPSSPIQPIS